MPANFNQGDADTPNSVESKDLPPQPESGSIDFATVQVSADGSRTTYVNSPAGGGGGGFFSKLFTGAAKVTAAIAPIYNSVANNGQTVPPVVVINPSSPSTSSATPDTSSFAGLLSALSNASAPSNSSQSDGPIAKAPVSILPIVLIVIGLAVVGYILYKHRKQASAA